MTSLERKRKRPAVSCTLCRRRKIRCNRETPCSNCIRSRNSACMYETEVSKGNHGHHESLQSRAMFDRPPTTASSTSTISTTPSHTLPSSASTTSNSPSSFELNALKARISELEEKLSQAGSTTASVYSIAPNSPAPTHTVQTITSLAGTIDVLQDSRAFGHAHAISRSIAHKNRVFGQSHWMNGFIVFRDIVEMLEPLLCSPSSPILANIKQAKTLARVIKSQRSPTWPTPLTRDLPAKHICDGLVDGYLRTIETTYRVLHVPSFTRDYEALWTTNTEAPLGFIVLLKLVLAIGAIVHDETCSMRIEATRWVYEAQTWLSSPTFKSRLGIQYLQTSILLLLARELIDVGSELVWISAGATFRAAVYIGLHRDPAQLPRMSFLEAEMRRRIWHTLLEVLLQTSLISGGPCLISLDDFTTQPPGNFDDEDLIDKDVAVKPHTVYTQTSIAIALQKTLAARITVVKFLNDTASPGTYEETLRIDTVLRTAYKALRRTLQAFASSPPPFALQAVDYILQRYITSLHVPFFAPSLDNPVYAFSRKAIVDSSLRIWNLAHPTPSNPSNPSYGIPTNTETDFSRLCRCGAGFFRAFTFHASTFLGVECRAQAQEDADGLSCSTSFSPLSTVVDDAANWYLACMHSGETGMKGYLLLRLLAAQIDAEKAGIGKEGLTSVLIRAAEEGTEKCLSVLVEMAGQGRGSEAATGMDDFSLPVSADFMEDWDLVMADGFSFGEGGSFDMFSI